MKDSTALLVLLALVLWKRDSAAAPSPPRSGKPAGQGTKREANRTAQTPDAARTQIAQSFEAVTGRAPTHVELAMLLAHSAGETGRWKSMYGWNYGFVTTLGAHDWFELPGNPLRFRWYATAADGCRDWLEVIRDGFPNAWEALGSGDVARYVDGLLHGRKGSYFGDAPPAVYARLVGALYAQYLPLAEGGRMAPQRAPRGREEPLMALRVAKR